MNILFFIDRLGPLEMFVNNLHVAYGSINLSIMIWCIICVVYGVILGQIMSIYLNSSSIITDNDQS